jgi:hypothetical protein
LNDEGGDLDIKRTHYLFWSASAEQRAERIAAYIDEQTGLQTAGFDNAGVDVGAVISYSAVAWARDLQNGQRPTAATMREIVVRYLEYSSLEDGQPRKRAYLSDRAAAAINDVGSWLESLADHPDYQLRVPKLRRAAKQEDGSQVDGWNERRILMLALFWMYDRLAA